MKLVRMGPAIRKRGVCCQQRRGKLGSPIANINIVAERKPKTKRKRSHLKRDQRTRPQEMLRKRNQTFLMKAIDVAKEKQGISLRGSHCHLENSLQGNRPEKN